MPRLHPNANQAECQRPAMMPVNKRGALIIGLILLTLGVASQALGESAEESAEESTGQATRPGEILFQQNCAFCHNNSAQTKAPSTQSLALMTAQSIYRIQVEGAMQPNAAHLNDTDKQLIAEYLSGQALADQAARRAQR